MTAPVSQTPAGDNDYFITFMMPKEFKRPTQHANPKISKPNLQNLAAGKQ